jgi:long-chain acyl-CoA synthetase
LIVSANFQPLLAKLKFAGLDKKIIVIGKKVSSQYHSWEEICAQNAVNSPDVNLQEDDIVYLNYTSGTTGAPKGAITTHANIFWNTASAIESLKLTHDDVHLCMFPVFGHPHEIFARPLYLGGTLVLIDGISPKVIAKVLSDHNVTCMMAVAPIYETLIRLYASHPFNYSSLRIPESGGMHTSPTLVKKFKKYFKVPIIPVWGSTEASGIALANRPDDVYKPGSMGRPCPYYQTKIIGEDGKELGPDEVGEMVLKGPAICSGYFGNPEETEKHMKDGWFFTGDLVKKDSEGYFYFASRKTGMMKVAGLKVFPTEIEDVISAHPKIAEVAVVKAQDGLHGEVPKAVIVLKEGIEIDKKSIRTFCKQRLSKYKVPRVIEFKPELPKTPGGKILHRKL